MHTVHTPPHECSQEQCGVALTDFHSLMPSHRYIFAPSRETWPAASVNARLDPVPVTTADGEPVLDDKGNQKMVSASAWLDQNRAVEQMTWAPGLPMIIEDRLIAEGGWIERDDVACFNLYRPPTVIYGSAALGRALARTRSQGFPGHRRPHNPMAGAPRSATAGQAESRSCPWWQLKASAKTRCLNP